MICWADMMEDTEDNLNKYTKRELIKKVESLQNDLSQDKKRFD